MDYEKLHRLYNYTYSSEDYRKCVIDTDPIGPKWEIVPVGGKGSDKAELLEWVPSRWTLWGVFSPIASTRLMRKPRECVCEDPHICPKCPIVW